MTEKRYYVNKHFLKQDKVHDRICHRFMSVEETVEHMNMYNSKYKSLKEENEELKNTIRHYADISACSVQVMDEDEDLKKDYASILCTEMTKLIEKNKELKKRLNYLSKKKKHYLCFDCEFSDNFEIECWCDKADQWVDCKHDCEDFRRIKND